MWLTDGDQNTKFFHAKAFSQQQRNAIHGLCDENGTWQMDDRVVEHKIVDYFSNIFCSNGQIDPIVVIEVIQLGNLEEMNVELSHEFQVGEVCRALKQLHPKKALSSDGMPPFFYQHY